MPIGRANPARERPYRASLTSFTRDPALTLAGRKDLLSCAVQLAVYDAVERSLVPNDLTRLEYAQAWQDVFALVARGFIYELGEAGFRDLLIRLATSPNAFEIAWRVDGPIDNILVDWPRMWRSV